MKVAKTLYILGVTWMILFLIVFSVGMVSIVIKDGLGKAIEIMSPYNFIGIIVNVISISPGLFLLWLSSKAEQKALKK